MLETKKGEKQILTQSAQRKTEKEILHLGKARNSGNE
jgi:hypothetical protein